MKTSNAIFLFYRAMHYCDCMSSVCLSVCPSVCDVDGSRAHRLENLQTNCTDNYCSLTPSLFVVRSPKTIHLFPGEHGEIWGRLEVGWEKVACCTKAVISLKRVKIEEKLLWKAYRNSTTLFQMVPSPTPYGLLFPKNGIQNFNRYYPRNGWSYGLQIGPVHSQCPSEQKPIKYFGEKEAWAYPGTAHIFGVPPIIPGTGKAMDFKFCTRINRIDRNKSLLKFSGKVHV